MHQNQVVDLRASTFHDPYIRLALPKVRALCAEHIRRLAGFPPSGALMLTQKSIIKLASHGALEEDAPHHVRPFGLYVLVRLLYPRDFRDLMSEAEEVGVYGTPAPDFAERVYAELRRVVARKQGACAPGEAGVGVVIID